MSTTYVPKSGEFPVNVYSAADQSIPAITGLADGRFVVTWQYNGDVFGRLYGSDGTSVTGEFLVNTYTDYFQGRCSVASLADGRFVVTWTSETQDGSSYGIYGQVYDESAVSVGDEFRVNTETLGQQIWPNVLGLTDGGFVVTWTNGFYGNSDAEIFGQIYSSDAVAVGDEFLVNSYTNNHQMFSASASLANGGFLVTWRSLEQDGSRFGIYGQVFSSAGERIGEEVRINTYTQSDQSYQSVTGLMSGGFVVTWASLGQDGSSLGVYAQLLSEDGSPVGDEFRVNTYTTNYQDEPSVTALTNDRFVVAWTSMLQDGSQTGVFAQVFNNDGSTVGGEFRVNTYTSDHQRNPVIASSDDGGFVVVWASSGQDGSGEGVYGQMFAEHANSSPVGEIEIGGILLQGQILTADVSGISDIDGIDGSSITYQWFRSGAEISGATASSYKLTQADVDNSISVRYAHIDDYGTSESLISTATTAVQNLNDAPTGAVTISGTAREDSTLTVVTTTIADADGLGSYNHQWFANGTVISGATASTFTPGQAQVGQAITVRVNYTDGQGTAESLTSAATTVVKIGTYISRSTSFVLPENGYTIGLTLNGTPDINGTGNSLNNTLTGNTGKNRLNGGNGNDTINGGNGNDTLDGGAGNDSLTGGAGNDTLVDGLGYDTVDGGEGIDTLLRTYSPSAPFNDTLIIDLMNGKVTSLADPSEAPDVLLNIENARVSGDLHFILKGDGQANLLETAAGNDSLFGAGGNDTLIGAGGNDNLDGGAGKDSLVGGIGNDTYMIDNAGDVVTEKASEGTDLVQSSVAYTLTANVESLTLTGTSNIAGTGNALDNIITGNGGNNLIDAGAGDDTLIGGKGVDTVSYATAASGVTVSLALTSTQDTGGAGTDTITLFENLTGSAFADNLTGSTGNNGLSGGDGTDTLVGGAGTDQLTGGLGADSFVFNAIKETSATSARDVILDFASGDKINLAGIDANSSQSGNQAFSFTNAAAFTALGQLHYTSIGGIWLVEGNTTGDTAADFSIEIRNSFVLQASDFVL